MRRDLSLIAAAIVAVGCASAEPPPGGPEDRMPPRLVAVRPDTNAVNVRDGKATFVFDEVINDRGTGAQDVSNYFLVSPSDGAPRVSWRRQRIEVRPRRGFRENTAYTITLLPGLADLRGNAMKAGQRIVFATGPTIPTGQITGIAFDWVAERTAPNAFIEAITADSIRYLAQADTGGRFTVGPLVPGSYLLRAIVDQNNNRGLDRNEAWDSVRVTVPLAAPAQLLTAPRDTIAIRSVAVAVVDSMTVRLTFDRLLDPAQPLPVANFRIVGADSVAVPIAAVRTPKEEQARGIALQQAAADSARRADSVAGRPRPAPSPTPAPGAAGRPVPPTPNRPPPFMTVTVALSGRLAPNAPYRATVGAVRSITGRVSTNVRASFTTPRPAPPPARDTTAAPAGAPAPSPTGGAGARPAAPATPPPTTPPVTPGTAPPSRP